MLKKSKRDSCTLNFLKVPEIIMRIDETSSKTCSVQTEDIYYRYWESFPKIIGLFYDIKSERKSNCNPGKIEFNWKIQI